MFARIRVEVSLKNILASLINNAGYKTKLTQKLIKYFKVKHVILTSSARVGLYYLLKVLPQKKIFIPAYTCWVVVEAAKKAGKEIEFIDINLSDLNLDVDSLKKIITPSSIILATHQFGIPCDIEKIITLAKKYHCYVIEDNAAAFGSRYKNQKTGLLAGASIISFEFSKPLTCGKGGAIFFTDSRLYQQVYRKYYLEIEQPNLFRAIKYILLCLGYRWLTNPSIYFLINKVFRLVAGQTTGFPKYHQNYQNDLYHFDLDNLRAKLAFLNLQKIKGVISKRQNIAKFYFQHLSGLKYLQLPSYPHYKSPSWMRFPVIVKRVSKNDYYQRCLDKGLDLGFTFSYSCNPVKNKCLNSAKAAKSVLNLPIYSHLNQTALMKIKNIILAVDKQ